MTADVVRDLDHPNDEPVTHGALLSMRRVAAVASSYIGPAVAATSESLGMQPGFGAAKWHPLIITMSALMFGATVRALKFLKKGRRTIRVAKQDDRKITSSLS
ncbi:hypothetical protein LZ32DRAFT_674626 [Colletotrichum eremochloae]|nr:hypothetical protein LZ32DRAFT_674626 [Colletotrichum eremochloae]